MSEDWGAKKPDAGADASKRDGGRDGSADAGPEDATPGEAEADANAATDAGVSFDGAFGPPPPDNPFTAGSGFASQHGDTAASDTSPLPGPGSGEVTAHPLDLTAACPSVLVTEEGPMFAVCTQHTTQSPAVFLLDADAQMELDSMALGAGELFAGVHPYLDADDRLVVVDGAHQMQRVQALQQGSEWVLVLQDTVSLETAVSDHCGGGDCDVVVGLAPGYEGRVWFATGGGVVGVVDWESHGVETLRLPEGERVANGLSTAPAGTAVVSDHALYMLEADPDGRPSVTFRAGYDRSSARKPGQLSHGSGSSPTFFGPRTGADYLAITDNARPTMRLLVYRAGGHGDPLCRLSLPEMAGEGTEVSPIGIGRSVFVSSSYGYPYPSVPSGAGTAVPEMDALIGGMLRVDVRADESGCDLVWDSPVRSAAVPKLSLEDELIYTMQRTPARDDGVASAGDNYSFVAVDPHTGALVAEHPLDGASDTMQLAGTLAPGRVLLQGTLTGILRIAPAE